MKFLKGCLLMFFLFGVIVFNALFLYNKKLSQEIIIDNHKTSESLISLKNTIHERNQLILKSKVSDSVKNLATKSDSTLKKYKKLNDILWTEFSINQKTYKIDNLKQINSELNIKLNNYNLSANQFNSKWLVFPNNLIISNNNLKSYEHLDIEYGKDNSENMMKRKEIEHWVKTGEIIK